MYKQICDSSNNNSLSLAYIYCENKNASYCRTYDDIKQESEQIKHLFSAVPKGVVIGVQLGKKPCLLPVIYCLLEFKIAFLLLEEDNSYEDYHSNVILHALITCNAHGEAKIDSSQKNCDKTYSQVTSLGCSYNFFKIKLKIIEETERSVLFNGICYVISTSGTLGRKKIVKVTENSIFSNIKSFIKLFNITHDDVIYYGTPLTFDPSLVELFMALTTGACLFATSKSIRNNPQKLLETIFLQDNISKSYGKSVTLIQMCPSVFAQFSDEQKYFIFFKSGLKTLGLGGEQFPVHIVPEQTPKTCKIYNFYGITEVSCWASVERVFYGEEVSIGAPLDETVFQIETVDGNLINLWEKSSMEGVRDEDYEGVLRIGSKTRLCFIHDENTDILNDWDNQDTENYVFRSTGDQVKVTNGKIFYLGRENDVIKRFGHRISLLKVQDLIYTSTQIQNKCTYYKDKLICFLQIYIHNIEHSNEFKLKAIDKIRVKLLKSLAPECMPDIIDILPEFPVKPHNGKLDTIILHQIAEQLLSDTKNTQVKEESKDIFLNLWCKYLGITGTTDMNVFYTKTFWDSGGNSIAALQLAQEYENLTNVAFNRLLLDLKLQEALNFINTCDDNVKFTKNIEHNHQTFEYSDIFRVIWKADMKACVDSSPVVCNISGRTYVAVGNFAHSFSIFDAECGQLIASIDLPNVIESAALVVGNDFYVPCFDGKLYRLHLSSQIGEENLGKFDCMWTYRTGDRHNNKPILIDQTIVFGSYDGYIYALKKDRVLKWQTLLGEPVTAEIKHSRGHLFIGALKGSIFCLSLKTGAILWWHNAQNPIFTPPELSTENDCVLFVDVQGNILCFSLTNINNPLLWVYEASNQSQSLKTFGSMLLLENRLFIGTQEGNINIFNFNESQCIFEESISLNPASSITTKPLYLTINQKNYLLVVSSVGCIQLFQINDINGMEKCSLVLIGVHSLPNECFSSPQVCIVHENRFYVGCRDNNLYCVELKL